MKSFKQTSRLSLVVSALALSSASIATPINTNDINVYDTFATGAKFHNHRA